MNMTTLRSLLLLALITLSGCSTLNVTDDPSRQVSSDPMKGLNKAIYSFNSAADKAILKPVAKAYDATLPKPAKKGVSNFFSNLGEPWSIVNNLLQGKFDRALSSTFRFTVNSTIGIFGLFDVASHYDVQPAKEDLGQTLAAWGVKPGPYVMLPIFGPSNLRDATGRISSAALFSPNNEITDSSATTISLSVLEAIDTRVGLLGTDELLENQLDEYGFLKIAYEQNRLEQIYDGNPPKKPEEDFDDF